jgi:ankyrin repeat protein
LGNILGEYFQTYLVTLPAGNSVLHIAAQNGRADVIDQLLLKGADVNKVT